MLRTKRALFSSATRYTAIATVDEREARLHHVVEDAHSINKYIMFTCESLFEIGAAAGPFDEIPHDALRYQSNSLLDLSTSARTSQIWEGATLMNAWPLMNPTRPF